MKTKEKCKRYFTFESFFFFFFFEVNAWFTYFRCKTKHSVEGVLIKEGVFIERFEKLQYQNMLLLMQNHCQDNTI